MSHETCKGCEFYCINANLHCAVHPSGRPDPCLDYRQKPPLVLPIATAPLEPIDEPRLIEPVAPVQSQKRGFWGWLHYLFC